MPETTYMQVDDRRDHSLRVPRPDLSERIGAPDACTGCHTDRTASWAASATEAWYGSPDAGPHFGDVLLAGRSGDPDAGPRLAGLARDTTLPSITRASVLALLLPYSQRVTVPAIQSGLEDPSPLVRLGALQAAEGLPPAGLMSLVYPFITDPVLSVRVAAARLLASVPTTSLPPDRVAVVEQAIAEYENVQRVNADHPGAWVNIGNVQMQGGQTADAEASFRVAVDLDSTFGGAYVNLADLLRGTGRDQLGAEVLQNALDLLPDAPELQHAMGLYEVRRGNSAAAVEWLERAARLAPGNARFAYVYGVALASERDAQSGVRVLTVALLQHPFNRDLLSALAAYQRDLGDFEAAIGYAERLVALNPGDAGARQFLNGLRAPR